MAAIFFLLSALISFMAAPLKRYMDQRQMALPQEDDDALTPIDEDDEDEEEEDNTQQQNHQIQVPTIIETAPTPNKPPLQEIQIESVV